MSSEVQRAEFHTDEEDLTLSLRLILGHGLGMALNSGTPNSVNDFVCYSEFFHLYQCKEDLERVCMFHLVWLP
jgi:hypothetical protein